MAIAALISVTPLLAPSLSMSWTSRTRISSLMRGPSLAAGCGDLIGRRMGVLSYAVATIYSPANRVIGSTRPRNALASNAHHDGCTSAMLFGECSRLGVFVGKSTTMRRDILHLSAYCG